MQKVCKILKLRNFKLCFAEHLSEDVFCCSVVICTRVRKTQRVCEENPVGKQHKYEKNAEKREDCDDCRAGEKTTEELVAN